MVNMKKLLKTLAVIAGAGCVLTLSACSGCGGTPDYKITTSPNWLVRGSSADDLAVHTPFLSGAEEAVYSVSFEKTENSIFSVDYGAGTYTTRLYATTYDRSDASIPEELRADESDEEIVYVYETALSLPVTYTMGEESASFENAITTVSYFRSAANNLLPVYSKQDIKSASPNSLQPDRLETAYVQMDRVYETWYSGDGSTAVTTVTVRGSDDGVESGTSSHSAAGEYTLFDASSLAVALRSMTQSSTQTFDVFIPINGRSYRYQAAWGSATTAALPEEETDKVTLGSVIAAMDKATEAGYLLAGADEEGNVNYDFVPVTVSLVSDMSGPSNVYYFAEVENPDLNSCRAVLGRMEESVPFGLGKLVYTLTSVEFTQNAADQG